MTLQGLFLLFLEPFNENGLEKQQMEKLVKETLLVYVQLWKQKKPKEAWKVYIQQSDEREKSLQLKSKTVSAKGKNIFCYMIPI